MRYLKCDLAITTPNRHTHTIFLFPSGFLFVLTLFVVIRLHLVLASIYWPFFVVVVAVVAVVASLMPPSADLPLYVRESSGFGGNGPYELCKRVK